MTVEILSKVYNKMCNITRYINVEKVDIEKSKGYPFVPNWSVDNIIEFLLLNRDNFNTFCDIGCGYNNLGFISELIGYKSFGIEINPQYVTGDWENRIVIGNILDSKPFGSLRTRINSGRKLTKTIFYSYSPLFIELGKGKSNYHDFFSNLQSIMCEDDIFIFVPICVENQRPILNRHFKKRDNVKLWIYEKKVPVLT